MDRLKNASEVTPASKADASAVEAAPPISASETFTVNLICGMSLALSFWISNSLYSIDLVTDPSLTLFLISVLSLYFSAFRFLNFSIFLTLHRLDYRASDRDSSLQSLSTESPTMFGNAASFISKIPLFL